MHTTTYEQMEAISDDFYKEMTPLGLVREYKRAVDFKNHLLEHTRLHYT